jgi:hypothetical protein
VPLDKTGTRLSGLFMMGTLIVIDGARARSVDARSTG